MYLFMEALRFIALLIKDYKTIILILDSKLQRMMWVTVLSLIISVTQVFSKYNTKFYILETEGIILMFNMKKFLCLKTCII